MNRTASGLLRRWQERDRRYRYWRATLSHMQVELIRGLRQQEADEVGNPPTLRAYMARWPGGIPVA
jgi:hypothetical protein